MIGQGNSKNFGPTEDSLLQSISLEPGQHAGYAQDNIYIVEKTSFSMMEDPKIKEYFDNHYSTEGSTVVIFGVITEGCILKTVISLRQQGVARIVVAEEATNSMDESER